MTSRSASCSCRQLSVDTVGDPIRISICHCLECQRRTGSVFGVQARFHTNTVTIRGRSATFVRVGDSGTKVTFHFCPVCGGTVHYSLERHPEIVGIPVGAFADPSSRRRFAQCTRSGCTRGLTYRRISSMCPKRVSPWLACTPPRG